MRAKGIVIAVVVALAAAASLGAAPLRIAVVMPSATSDMAFSQSMWGALQSVQKDMGGTSAIELKYSENMCNVPDAAAAVRDYASQGFDIVIAHGSQYGSSVQEIAKDFPKVTFAWGTDVNTFGMPNVYAYTAAAEQGGYVNGVLAAKLSKSKKIGVTGPVEVGDAKTYIDGFLQGVQSVDTKITISKTWTGSFSDVALMAAAAKTHIASGADILTGSSQSVVGSIGAAKDKGGVLWFGTQADQASLAPDLVVASQVYDWTGHAEGHHRQAQGGRPGRDHLHPDPGKRRAEGGLQPRVRHSRGGEGGRRCRHPGHHEGLHQGGRSRSFRAEGAHGRILKAFGSSGRVENAREAGNVIRHVRTSQMRDIVKCFPGVVANSKVCFDVAAGEVHALLGENGAGKSTLMRQLYGLYQPDEGDIIIDGSRMSFRSPADAIRAGIGMIHQHFMLVPTLTVAQNVALGQRSSRAPLLDLKKVTARIEELSEEYGIEGGSPGVRLAALRRGAAARGDHEGALPRGQPDHPGRADGRAHPAGGQRPVRHPAAHGGEGHSLVFISHKLHEVMAISDRVTVLRDGKVIGTRPTTEVTRDELVSNDGGPGAEGPRAAAAASPAR